MRAPHQPLVRGNLRLPGLFLACGWILACSARAPAHPVGEQVAFGVDMARRGLWSEALFRFEQAAASSPQDAQVLNNLAVACEAVGQFERALETYRAALKAEPGNRELKQNYARFVEFYQGFRPQAPAAPSTPTSESTPAAGPPADEAPPEGEGGQ